MGRARAGKSEFCEAIYGHCGYVGTPCEIYDLGDEVRRHCIAEGLLPDKARTALNAEELAVLIRVGREQRESNDHFWIDKIARRIREDEKDVALIPNLRYENECAWVRDQGGVLVRIERRNPDGSPYISLDRDPNDVSECGLLFYPANHVILNEEKWLLRDYALTLFKHLWQNGNRKTA